MYQWVAIMKNYIGEYTTQNNETVPLKVSFNSNYNYNGNSLRVDVQDFTVNFGQTSYEIKPLVKGDDISENFLREALSINNPEIANYGDGTHHNHDKVQKKIDLWGIRDGIMRCFIPQDENSSGYFNTGTSLVKTQYHDVPLESGILKSSTGNIDVMKTTGIAVRCLMNDAYNTTRDLQGEEGALSSNLGIYTVNPDNETTINILKGCGYKNLVNNTGLQKDLVFSSDRFKYEDDKFLEGQNNIEKLLYSCDYSELPEGITLAGNVEDVNQAVQIELGEQQNIY